MSLEVQRCNDCSRRWFPIRLCCPGCGASAFRTEVVGRGRVEEVTTLPDGRVLASVMAEGEIPLVARLIGTVQSGDEVAITTDPTASGPSAYVPHGSLEEEKA